jgi:hypothetical protein
MQRQLLIYHKNSTVFRKQSQISKRHHKDEKFHAEILRSTKTDPHVLTRSLIETKIESCQSAKLSNQKI